MKALWLAPLLCSVSALTLAGAAQAQATDTTPINLIVGYAPGGSTDRIARLLSERVSATLGVPVVVENRTGAGGRLAAQYLARQTGNQHTLMVGNPAVMVVAPLVYADAGYDPASFQTVSIVNNYRFALAVPADAPVQDIASLRTWLAENPGKANLGVPATGSLPHFFALMLGEALGQPVEVIGYRGSGPLLTELLGGHVPMALDTYETLVQQHQGGKVRILAISADEREAATPDVPTFTEAGVNLTASGWNGLFAPAGMSAERVSQLANAVTQAMREPGMQQAVRDSFMEPVVAGPAESQAILDAFSQQWVPVVRESGFKVEQ